MSIEAIVNASPLICLDKIGALELLGSIYKYCWVTEEVLTEIRAGEGGAFLDKKLRQYPWIKVIEVQETPERLIEWNLGRGETSMIAAALERPDLEVILDDRAAAKCARSFGLSLRGTIGVLLLAKKEGKLEEIKSSLDALRKAGLWLSESIYERALEKAGEG
jgi:predicted nucleic acid-binding protein